MASRVALVLAVILVGAGCVTDAPIEPASSPAPEREVLVGERPDPTFGDIPEARLGTLAAPDANATLDAAPKLIPGEWWRVKFSSTFANVESTFVRVVAQVNPDGSYVVGMPHEGWWKEAIIFHTPGLGDVGADLSYAAHDIPFHPLEFPLEDGKTWTTYWQTDSVPLTPTVEVVDAWTADIIVTGPNCGIVTLIIGCDPESAATGVVIEMRYDARVHEVVMFKSEGMMWEVVEHGYGFEGWVTVPRAERLVFFNGRFVTPAVDITLAPAPPVETVAVDGGYNRVSFILAAGGFAPGAGVFREEAIAPDGTEYSHENIGGPLTISFHEQADPDGNWQLRHLIAGAGYGFIEGIAYHQYDIHLPSGNIRSDHSHEVIR